MSEGNHYVVISQAEFVVNNGILKKEKYDGKGGGDIALFPSTFCLYS